MKEQQQKKTTAFHIRFVDLPMGDDVQWHMPYDHWLLPLQDSEGDLLQQSAAQHQPAPSSGAHEVCLQPLSHGGVEQVVNNAQYLPADAFLPPQVDPMPLQPAPIFGAHEVYVQPPPHGGVHTVVGHLQHLPTDPFLPSLDPMPLQPAPVFGAHEVCVQPPPHGGGHTVIDNSQHFPAGAVLPPHVVDHPMALQPAPCDVVGNMQPFQNVAIQPAPVFGAHEVCVQPPPHGGVHTVIDNSQHFPAGAFLPPHVVDHPMALQPAPCDVVGNMQPFHNVVDQITIQPAPVFGAHEVCVQPAHTVVDNSQHFPADAFLPPHVVDHPMALQPAPCDVVGNMQPFVVDPMPLQPGPSFGAHEMCVQPLSHGGVEQVVNNFQYLPADAFLPPQVVDPMTLQPAPFDVVGNMQPFVVDPKPLQPGPSFGAHEMCVQPLTHGGVEQVVNNFQYLPADAVLPPQVVDPMTLQPAPFDVVGNMQPLPNVVDPKPLQPGPSFGAHEVCVQPPPHGGVHNVVGNFQPVQHDAFHPAHVVDQSLLGPPSGPPVPLHHGHLQPSVEKPFVDPEVQRILEGGIPMNIQELDGASVLCTLPPPAENTEAISLATQAEIQPATHPETHVVAVDATTSELEGLPELAIVKLDIGCTLTAQVCKTSGSIGWEWARAVEFMEMQRKKNHVYLQRNQGVFRQEFAAAEIPFSEFQYRGAKSQDVGHHSFGISAFILMMLLVSINRKCAVTSKQKALELASNVLRVASRIALEAVCVACLVYGYDKQYHEVHLCMGAGCVLQGFDSLLSKDPRMLTIWDQLMDSGWKQQKITTPPKYASLWDALLLMLYFKNKPKLYNLWCFVGQFVLPKLVYLASKALDALAIQRKALPLEQLPLLKATKKNKRSLPWVNRIILLQRLKKMKHHRKQAMQTHPDLVAPGDQLVSGEYTITCGLYLQNSKAAFAGVKHLTIAWDPSSYDCSTLVGIAYSHEKDMACYTPIQNITPLLKKDVHLDLQQLGGRGKLTRLDGYTELRALSHCMRALGLPIDKFFLDPAIQWKPLTQFQARVQKNRKIFIQDLQSKKLMQVLPDDWNIRNQPLLCSISDQGGINRASLDYICFKLGQPVLILFDPFHRAWNDLRDTLKKTRVNLFKTLLAYSLVWNCNYGPQGSKEWFQRKKQKLSDLFLTSSPNEEPFLSYLPHICFERGLEEPSDQQGRERVWDSLSSLNTTSSLGPLVKLMRWFSWFETEKHYRGEDFCTKLIMSFNESGSIDPLKGVDFVKNETLQQIEAASKISEKQELAQLKIKHGTWNLAPLMITPQSQFQKTLIATLCQQCWLHHSKRAKHILTPSQVCKWTIGMVQGGWKEELLDLMFDAFHNIENFKKLYPDGSVQLEVKQSRLAMHFDLCSKLVAKRASSLIAFYCVPPYRYSPMLLPEWKLLAKHQMNSDFQVLLSWESISQKGQHVHGLQELQFMGSSYTRLCYLLNEQDLLSGTDEASIMFQHALLHLGDTACIESTHSSAKDSLRDSRSNFRSRISKFYHVFKAKVLESRKTNHVKVSDAQIATAKMKGLPSVTDATFPNSHVLNKSFQLLMQHKAKHHFWHATTPMSLFQQAIALEWLLKGPGQVRDLNPLLSCLAGPPGTVVAAKDATEALMVLCSCSFGFVGWKLEVRSQVEDCVAYSPIPKASAINVHHIVDLKAEGWVEIKVKPQTQGQHGGLLLVSDGKSEPLMIARVRSGLSLTVKQLQACLASLGKNVSAQVGKPTIIQMLIDLVLETQDERTDAAQKALQASDEDQDVDSDYEALVELVQEDAENFKDPDLVQAKEKLARRRHAKNIKKGPPDSLLQTKRGRGRGKGRGKGRGRKDAEHSEKPKMRGRGKGRGKGRGRGKKRKLQDVDANIPPLQDAPPSVEPETSITAPNASVQADASSDSPAVPKQQGPSPVVAAPNASVQADAISDSLALPNQDDPSPVVAAPNASVQADASSDILAVPKQQGPSPVVAAPNASVQADAISDSLALPNQDDPSPVVAAPNASVQADAISDSLALPNQDDPSPVVAAPNASVQADAISDSLVLPSQDDPSPVIASPNASVQADARSESLALPNQDDPSPVIAAPNASVQADASSESLVVPKQDDPSLVSADASEKANETSASSSVPKHPDPSPVFADPSLVNANASSASVLGNGGIGESQNGQPPTDAASESKQPSGGPKPVEIASRARGPALFFTPKSLSDLGPPGCSIRLSGILVLFIHFKFYFN